jgi:hypothetical protein
MYTVRHTSRDFSWHPSFAGDFFLRFFFTSVLKGVTSAGISYLLGVTEKSQEQFSTYVHTQQMHYALGHLNHQRITSITQHHDNRLVVYFITHLLDTCAMCIELLNPNKQALRVLLP